MSANVNAIRESIGTQSAAFAAKENDFAERVTTANGMYETTEQENTARVQAAGQGMGDEKEHRHGAKPVDYKRDKGDDPKKPDPDKPNPKDQNLNYPRRSADGTYRGGNDGLDGKLDEKQALDKLERETGTKIIRQQVRATVDGANRKDPITGKRTGPQQYRYYDGLMPTGTPGEYIGIEAKGHGVDRTPDQK